MLSVILPNFNHGKYIAHALSALLDQKLLPSEIIIIDDGSTDDSLSIINQFAAASSTIRILINAERTGVVAALRRGLEHVHERYVYFAAADDWVMPGFFALATSMLEAHSQAGLFCGETMLIDGNTERLMGIRPIVRPTNSLGYIDAEHACQLLMWIDNWILTGSAVFRRDAIVEAGGLHQELGSFADGYLARKVALAHGFCFAPQLVSIWRIFSTGVSRHMAIELERAKEVLQTVPARIESDPVFPPWYADVFRKRWRFATSRLALQMEPINRSVLLSLGAASSFDRTAFKLIWALLTPRLASVATLAWLYVRWRPTSALGVVRTAITRRLERLIRQAPDS
jgi:glycosyltransferase involved in cell wall biosynthesis